MGRHRLRCRHCGPALGRIDDQVVELVVLGLLLGLEVRVAIVELLLADDAHLAPPLEHSLLLELVLCHTHLIHHLFMLLFTLQSHLLFML